MAEQTISPGVFTEERDQTFLQQGVQEIGGAFVGPTQKGPAFEPVEVSSPQQYEERFGNKGLYMDYSTTNYLTDASSATVVRLLGEEGYEAESVEIQLPAGELSKRSFQVSKAEFSFDADLGIDEEVDARICFRGRQRRSSVSDALTYDIKIHEYVNGEYNGVVSEQNAVDKDCYNATFEPISDEFASVYYEVEAERADGQMATIESPTVQLQGFHLENVNYNFVGGQQKGEQEIVSLSGVVDNVDGSYDVEIYEVVNGNLRDQPVAEKGGVVDNRFRIAFVHGGRASDRLTYVVKVESGGVEDVPDEVSPVVDVIEREETTGFELQSVNFNFENNETVDYGQKLQIDAEANMEITGQRLITNEGNNTFSPADVSGNPDDSSIYLEFSVGDSGADVSTGNVIEYVLEVETEDESGNTVSRQVTSPEIEVEGGVFRIGELRTDFEEGDEVAENQLSGVSFEVKNENSTPTPFDYEIYEIIDGDNANETQIASDTDVGAGTSNFFPQENVLSIGLQNNASFTESVQYRVSVSQSGSQGATIASSDSVKTPTQQVRNLSPLGEFGIQTASFGVEENDVITSGDNVFGNFVVDSDGSINYTYEVEAFRNGQATGNIAVSDTSNADDSYFVNFEVSDTTFFDGDEVFYRIRIENNNGDVDTFDSPTLLFEGRENVTFGIEDHQFQFAANEEVDLNERLAVNFETRRPSWGQTGQQYALRYRVVEYINDSMTGNVVTTNLEEVGNENVLQGNGTPQDPQTNFEGSWFVARDTMATIGDEAKYEVVAEQYDVGNETVINSETVTSENVEIVEQTPKADVALALVSPTKRLRRQGDTILDAQINPNKSDIKGFELILGLESNEPDQGNEGNGGGQASGMGENLVQDLLDQTDENNLSQSQDLTIDGKTYQVSLQEGDSNYLLDLFGETVDSPLEIFARDSFPEVWKELIQDHYGESGINLKAEYDPAQLDFDGQAYSGAETPWIVSQDQQPNEPGAERQKLFKLETLGDGNYSNTEVKASVRNVRYPEEVPGSDYGEFDVVVRELGDSDTNPTVIESFSGLNLDPSSPNYIERVIGNRETVLTEDGKLKEMGGEAGVFENKSSYVRVTVHPEVVRANQRGKNGLAHLVPWGFQPYQIPVDYSGQVPHGLKPKLTQSVAGVENDILPETGINQDISSASAPFDNRVHFGLDLDFEGNMNWLAPVAENADASSEQEEFNQDFGFVLADAYVRDPTGQGLRQIEYGDGKAEGFEPSRRKFTVGFQGGFDGMDPAKPEALEENITAQNSQGFYLSGPDADGTQAYGRAIGILGNEDQFDINLLVLPGVINSLHAPVIDAGIDMVEQRSDCFFVFDAAGVDATVEGAIASIESVDTSYAATYYPWMRIRDAERNKQVRVPPSVLIPRVYAFNDQTSAEWFAPAGFERGGVPEAVSAVVRLRREDRDELYRSRVNPIAQFPGQGVSVWGQKTLQTRATALDRVNVRRLLIRVKKFIASTSRFLVFEQNVPETRNRFLNIVRPFLNQVQQQNGLFAFRVKMDADNNPPEVVDRNKLVGEIFLQPTRTAEFIELTFNVLPTGAEFEG